MRFKYSQGHAQMSFDRTENIVTVIRSAVMIWIMTWTDELIAESCGRKIKISEKKSCPCLRIFTEQGIMTRKQEEVVPPQGCK